MEETYEHAHTHEESRVDARVLGHTLAAGLQSFARERSVGAVSVEERHFRGTVHVPEFRCESGELLSHVEVAYETWGTLSADKDNVIVVCHALTGDAHAGAGSEGPGWWSSFIGRGKAIDTREWFVVCSNVLGGCSGTTGPASLKEDGLPYALSFPLVTVRDMVQLQKQLLLQLGISSVRMVVGGSLGGMQAWEWTLIGADMVQSACIIAAHPAFPPLGIGYNAAQRQAITSDPAWQNGRYYGTGEFPSAGLALARSIGMLTYRAGGLYEERFARRLVREDTLTPEEAFSSPVYQVESYLNYHGQKFIRRFDANSYLYLTKAMDTHDIGRGRGGLQSAFRDISCKVSVIGIDSDYLYDAADLKRAANLARQSGVACSYFHLSSPHGHDGFLVEDSALARMIRMQL